MDPVFEFALLIKAGQRELERRTNEVMQPLGLTAAQADAIAVLGRTGPLSLKELGELLIAEAGHPSRLVDRLVAAGVVDRRAADDDRRQIELSLTRKGRELEKQVQRARDDLFALARSLIGARDLEPVLEFLRDLTRYSSFKELVDRRRALEEGAGVASAGRG
jgi:DNA-binding MarR family transcriptional regulator